MRHSPPPAPARPPAVAAHKHQSLHTHNRTRQDDAPLPRPAEKKKLSKLSRAPPARLCPTPAPRTDFSERLFRPRGPWLGAGRLGRGRGAPGERAAYLPGLTLGLTARGWKAPRGLTSDPLSSPPRFPRPPPLARREKTNFVRSAASYAHPPAGRDDSGRGLRPAHRARRGRGRAGTFFLRPPPPAGMPHGLGRGAVGARLRESPLGGRKWPVPPLGERFRSAYCVLQAGSRGRLPRGEVMQSLTFVRPLPPARLPPAV